MLNHTACLLLFAATTVALSIAQDEDEVEVERTMQVYDLRSLRDASLTREWGVNMIRPGEIEINALEADGNRDLKCCLK